MVTADGTDHPVDTIILGTGFAVAEPPIARGIVGADGRTLAEHWAGSPTAYLGTTVAGFPNLFVIVGPEHRARPLVDDLHDGEPVQLHRRRAEGP